MGLSDSTIFKDNLFHQQKQFFLPSCEQKFYRRALISVRLLSIFFLSFLMINEENAWFVDGKSLEIDLSIFLFDRLEL